MLHNKISDTILFGTELRNNLNGIVPFFHQHRTKAALCQAMSGANAIPKCTVMTITRVGTPAPTHP